MDFVSTSTREHIDTRPRGCYNLGVDKTAKGTLHIRLSQEALAELERRAKRAGSTRQALIEDWLTRSPAKPYEASLARTVIKTGTDADFGRRPVEYPPERCEHGEPKFMCKRSHKK